MQSLLNEAQKAQRIAGTLHNIAEDRGFTVPEGYPDLTDSQACHQWYTQRVLLDTRRAVAPESASLLVIRHTKDNVGAAALLAIKTELKHADQAIVLLNKITPAAAKAFISTLGRRVEWFYEHELLVDITRHALQPEFQALSPAAAAAIVQKFGLTDQGKLPSLLWDDPVRKHFGWAPDTLVQVTRRYGHGLATQIVYRTVTTQPKPK